MLEANENKIVKPNKRKIITETNLEFCIIFKFYHKYKFIRQ